MCLYFGVHFLLVSIYTTKYFIRMIFYMIWIYIGSKCLLNVKDACEDAYSFYIGHNGWVVIEFRQTQVHCYFIRDPVTAVLVEKGSFMIEGLSVSMMRTVRCSHERFVHTKVVYLYSTLYIYFHRNKTLTACFNSFPSLSVSQNHDS